MIPAWLMFVLVFGINFTLWGTIGFLRIVDGALDRLRRLPRNAGSLAHRILRADRAIQAAGNGGLTGPALAPGGGRMLTVADLAVLMAAHNEEVVIDDSLTAITALVPPRNVHVVSDASTDKTVALARQHGVNVIETAVNVGKAGALEEGIRVFGLVERFSVVLLLDADTRLDPDYFRAGLPLFDDPDIVAVAGCAHSNWHVPGLSFLGRLVTAHRSRIYALTQRLLKYGQTWRRTNATHIVPGFASMYRTAVLPDITINPVGLVIEDFNMTFEVYRKHLGRVGFTVAARAVTQDPATVHDYIKQTKRWALGLWQTVRRHRLRLDLLSAMLCVLLLELLTASLAFLVLPVVVIILAVPDVFPQVLHWHAASGVHATVTSHVSLRAIGLGVLLPDLLLTVIVAAVERRPRYLIYAPFLIFMRMIDAAIALYTLPRAWQEKSTGRWASPARRDPAGGAAVRRAGQLPERPPEPEPSAGPGRLPEPERLPQLEPAGAGGEPAGVRGEPAKVVQAGGVVARVRLGRLSAITLDPPELAEVRTWWTRAADDDDTADADPAQDHLRVLLTTEPGTPELAEVRMWWTRAAEAGDTAAQNNLGVLLTTELDPPELGEARMWWTRAAEAGHTEAQYCLARLLAGLLDPPEPEEARAWYTRAAEAGHDDARLRLEADVHSPAGADVHSPAG